MTFQKPAALTAAPQPTMTTPSSRASRAMTTCGKPRRRSRAPRTPPQHPTSSFTRPEGKPPQPGTEKPLGSFLTRLPSRMRSLGHTKQREGPCSVKGLFPSPGRSRVQNSPRNLRMGAKHKSDRLCGPRGAACDRDKERGCAGSGSPGEGTALPPWK